MTHSETIILLCAPLAESTQAPLTPAKWADLEAKIADAGMSGPAELADIEHLEKELGLSAEDAARVRALLQRGETLAAELERLQNIGVWIVTQADDDYPRRLRSYLDRQTPPLLFGIGERSLLNTSGLAIVGSRDADESSRTYARETATACAAQGIAVVSGGARGVDQISMDAAFQEGGIVIGALADSLEAAAARRDIREATDEGRLALVTPFKPNTGFLIGLAMARNKLLYALADWGLVVRADHNKGGSWAGAVEALRNGRRAVFVRDAEDAGPGNAALLRRGAMPFPAPPWNHLAARMNRAFEETIRSGPAESGENLTQMELF